MHSFALALLFCPVLAAADSVEVGTVLQYRGSFVAAKGDPADSRKTFELTVVIERADANGAVVAWTLAERGRGAWGWPDRFGRAEVDARWRTDGPITPALFYERDDGKSIVPLALPLFAAESTLEKGADWEEGRLKFEVIGAEQSAGHDCWRVESRDPFGRRRTQWVQKNSPVVVAVKEKVIIGQGQDCDLRFELVESKVLSPDDLAKTSGGFDRLLDLRTQLKREPRTPDAIWSDEQLAKLKAELPSLAGLAKSPLLAEVVKAVDQDVKLQKGRSGAVASLREKAVGTEVGALKLDGLAGKGLTHDELKDKVTILHFWEYRDAPLEEPYGQTGFLDFLYRQRGKAGVQVFGVAVDERLADQGTRRAAVRSVGGFKAFMNLSYPLLLDDGGVLKRFGDPRVTGAKLPLFVVIGRNGKVLEYHAGHYEVHRDRGLEELDALVTRALESRE